MDSKLVRFGSAAICTILLACVAAQNVRAQADRENCYKVDRGNLKVYESDTTGVYGHYWEVRDITNDWVFSFVGQSAAKRFADILKAYDIETFCQRLAGRDRTIQYMLTTGGKAPTGNRLGGEACTNFDPAALRVDWSDEYKQFVLTDGKVVVIFDWPRSKGDLLDALSTIKKYEFTTRCRAQLGPVGRDSDIEYWRAKPIVFTRAGTPGPGIETSTELLPPSYPLVCRGAKEVLVATKPEAALALTFNRSTYPASVGLSPGQCSWLDRGVLKEEPNLLVHQVDAGRDAAPEYKWKEELKDPAAYWTFKVYNDGRGQFVVTGAKPGGVPRPAPPGMEGWESLGGNLGSGPAAAVQKLTGVARVLHVFARGFDGALWTRSKTAGKWSEWTSLGGVITSSPSAAAAFNSPNLIVVARRTDNAMWFRHLNGAKWDEWKSLGGEFKGAPAVTTRQGERFAVFGVGTDGAIWQTNFDGVNPSEWSSLEKTREGIGFLYGPGATAPSANGMEVYAVGTDTQVYTKVWFRSCDCWSLNWELLGGEANGAPAAAYIGGVTIVLARGPGLDLMKARITSTSTRIRPKWESLGGKLFTDPSVLLAGGGEFDVFGVAADNALWWRTFRDE